MTGEPNTGRLDRRGFLRATGLAAGLGVATTAFAACGGPTGQSAPGTKPATPTSATPPSTTATAPGPIDYAALAGKLSGHLVRPGQSGYSAASRSYNPLFDGRQPAAIALCTKPADVQACVSAAAASATPIAARGGGHSYAGYSTPNGALVVDLAGLSGITINPDGSMVVGAGARLIDVYAAAGNAGRAIGAGSCPSVGIAGLTLGGGIGVLGRKFGLTCDQLTSATIVTPDGVQRTASANSEPNLFWALRGGGGGNFGIVTSFTFATAPAPSVLIFTMQFPAGSVAAVLGAWQQWSMAAPDELWSTCNVAGGSPATCSVTGTFIGSASALTAQLSALTRATGVSPSSRYVLSKSYLDAMRYFAGCSSDSIEQCHLSTAGGKLGRESFVASSRMVNSPIGDPGSIASLCAGKNGLNLVFDALGGAIGRVGADATAFPYRSAVASVQIYQKLNISQQAATRVVGEVRDTLAGPLGTTGYVNYIDPAMPNWGQAYYGNNLARLRQVAGQYDPHGVFSFPQAISKA
ncbi:MAG TPA: FAD-binding protein [Pseudonocardiaceae bacterium]|jgi:FAD/FMN-containing dehydrogenase|nr:FAD-binding protein [Pseudonocardiaceae bacterium]